MDMTESIQPRSDQIEHWRPVRDYPGYEVSTLGRVRSIDRVTDRGRKWRGRMMTPSSMPRGYQVVTLWREGKQRTALVHRLVLAAFVGPAPEGMEALHADGDATNANLANLSWGTHAENQADQVEHGTHHNASKDRCPSGHPYDDANTYVYPGRAHRGCRTCRREHAREYARSARKAA